MGQRLLFWSGWIFTVFGVIVSLVLVKEFAWIGALMAVAGLIPLGSHSWWVHQRLQEADRRHHDELEAARQRNTDEVKRREQAEQRLALIPAEALARLAELVSEGKMNELIASMQRKAEWLSRARQYQKTLNKPLRVRTFQYIQAELYVIASGIGEAVLNLRPGDPFILRRQSEAGIVVESARLIVNQPVEAGKDRVHFRAVEMLADDMIHLAGLAGDQAVEGIKGFSIAIDANMETTPQIDFASVAEAIPHLASTPQGK
jgi:hypothetical protein